MAKTILFDIGGVLVHLDWEKVCGPLSELSDLSPGAVDAEVKNGPIVEESMLGHLTPDEFHLQICAELNVDIPFDRFIELWNSILRPDESILPLVQQLGDGHRLAVASNTDAIHFAHTKDDFGILESFQEFFLSCEMGLLKPDPAFFQRILGGLGAPPEECVFIDDRPENVESARTLGIDALHFQSLEKLETDLKTVL
ncbi:MAG: hypothetical protein CL732_07590 [Chloroflexi bacterium]|nr:hypothetical protein [Chloroflexota bacterium]